MNPSSADRGQRSAVQSLQTVLVVEDEFLIRWAIRNLLIKEGVAVVEAPDAASARAAFAPAVDVALLDVRLPDGNGMELLAEFHAKQPDTQIIVMTAHGTEAMEREAVALGAFALVHKPFRLDDALALVRRAMTAATAAKLTHPDEAP